MEFREHVLLAPYTTFQIGGPARWFVEAHNEDQVLEAILFAREKGLPLLVLGGGSNLLIADDGFPGLVLHISLQGITESRREEGKRRFVVAAGENWDAFVSIMVEQSCGGVECLAGIPGTVGGTPIQNVGAYGQEVSSTITHVRALDLASLEFVELANAECGFAYRTSIFNTAGRLQYIVTAVEFQLLKPAAPTISYKDIALYFKDATAQPSLSEVAATVRKIRHGKGMLLVAGEDDCRSAGSFFKNPQLSPESLTTFAGMIGMDVKDIPQFPAAAGRAKVPAAWVLEKAGFHKGYRLGRAGISSRHTLAVINTGGASAGEILALRDHIRQCVLEKFGIELETEPVMP